MSENFKLRLVDPEGVVRKAGVRAVPPLPGTVYFVGIRSPVATPSSKEFSDFKAQELFQEVSNLTAAVPDFACRVGQPNYAPNNHAYLSGDLSGPGPWSLWVTQARHYAASMAEIKHHHPLPSEDHHFSVFKVAKCHWVPPEVFGFLGAPKIKLNPLSTPFLAPSTNLIEKDFRYRQRP